MSWTVLNVAYPFAPVSEDAVGGSEQVLAMLDRALVQAGHRSMVIAAEGSRVSGTLIPLPAMPASIDDQVRMRVHRTVRDSLAATLASTRLDIVHLHGVDFAEYLPAPGVPAVATLHLPLDWYAAGSLNLGRPRTYLHCVSASQQASAPDGARLLPYIPNGVNLEHFRLREHKRNFALLLGRICPEKGVDIALRACKRAGSPLLIGGQVYPYPAHETYFHDSVEPFLDACRRFLGPLALPRKTALLAAANCLLIPSLAAETSSLVAMEALASGTPVIAFRSGALPEIIKSGHSGFVVDGEEEMAGAIRCVSQIFPRACREEACKRFDQQRTIRRYFEMYQHILTQQ